jgi:hypothetical protein
MEIIYEVEAESIRTQYVSAERQINDVVNSIDIYYEMMNKTQPIDAFATGALSTFIKWGGMVRESVSFLFDGVLGYGIIGSDILQTIANNVNHNHPPLKRPQESNKPNPCLSVCNTIVRTDQRGSHHARYFLECQQLE